MQEHGFWQDGDCLQLECVSPLQTGTVTETVSPRRRGLTPRRLSVVAGTLAVLALIILVTLTFDHELHQPQAGSLLALILASMITGAAITLFAWLITSSAHRDAPPRSVVRAGGFYGPATDSANLPLHRTLTRHGYWTDSPDGVLRQVEPAADDDQLRLRELIGKSRRALAMDEAGLDTITGIEQAMAARKPYREVVWRCRLPGARALTVRESGAPRFDANGRFLGYHGFIEDITSQTTDPVRAQLLIQALDALPLPLALLNGTAEASGESSWKLVWANTPMALLTGRTQAELTESRIHNWMLCVPGPRANGRNNLPSERSRSGPLLAYLLATENAYRGDGLIIDRYGLRRAVQLSLQHIESPQTTGRTFLVAADPNAAVLKSLENRIAALNQAQSRASRRALEVDITARELDAFSQTVSQDLRHPIRIIEGFTQILREDYGQLFDRTGNEHLSRILGAAQRMTTMIDALADLHGISSQPIAEDPVDLSSLAGSIIDDLRSTEPEREVQVVIEPHLSCRGDRVLLRIALFNLLENAWKFTSRTDRASIRVDSIALHDARVFRVSDNGAGFDKRFAEQLFTLFYRLHSQSEFGGAGIGLATTQRIIQRHGGRIWAESAPDQGASFMFTLWDMGPDKLAPLQDLSDLGV